MRETVFRRGIGDPLYYLHYSSWVAEFFLPGRLKFNCVFFVVRIVIVSACVLSF